MHRYLFFFKMVLKGESNPRGFPYHPLKMVVVCAGFAVRAGFR